MKFESLIEEQLHESYKVVSKMTNDKPLINAINQVASACIEAIKNGNKILIAGNGGSAADAQHIAAEFVNRYKLNRSPLPAISLTSDIAVITSISNDFSYDLVFVKQIQALGNKGDVLWAISTSGESGNIISGIKQAKDLGLVSISFSGCSDNSIRKLSDYSIVVPSKETERVQEALLIVVHTLCKIIELECSEK